MTEEALIYGYKVYTLSMQSTRHKEKQTYRLNVYNIIKFNGVPLKKAQSSYTTTSVVTRSTQYYMTIGSLRFTFTRNV